MIKDGKTSRLGQCLDDVRSELELVISSISLLDHADESAPKPRIEEHVAGDGIVTQEVLILFDKLRTLMADNDTASLDMVADIGNRLEGSMFQANMEPIREALEQYDFDKGIEILDKIIGELNRSESED
jgi:translation initiation factor 2 gamma subunit (eIF-2gamma)